MDQTCRRNTRITRKYSAELSCAWGVSWVLILDDVLQPQVRNLFDFTERCLKFLFARVAESGLHRVENRLLRVQAGADDERETEALAIGRVQFLKPCNLRFAERAHARARLLAGRFGGELALRREAPGEIGVRVDQRELPFAWRRAHRGAERGVKVRRIEERTL